MLSPHTIMCMGVESLTEENRSPLHVWTYIADGGIGCAPAVSLRAGSVCWATLLGDAHRRSLEQEQEDAGPCGVYQTPEH